MGEGFGCHFFMYFFFLLVCLYQRKGKEMNTQIEQKLYEGYEVKKKTGSYIHNYYEKVLSTLYIFFFPLAFVNGDKKSI